MLSNKAGKAFLFSFLVSLSMEASLSAQTSHELRRMESFENIVVEGSATTFVYITQSKSCGVKIKAHQHHISQVSSTVTAGTLTLYLDPRELGHARIEIYVSLPVIKKISIRGGGNVELIDGADQSVLQTSIRGGGTLLFHESADIRKFQGEVLGGGSINALKLKVKDAQIRVRGGGEVLVRVENELEGSITGGGSILYSGYPEVISQVSGGGRIAKR